MEHNRLINEFLDGSILSSDEDKLLMLIATSDDVRGEFKRALTIETSLKNDALSVGPSATTTMQIFSNLGFSAPATAIATGTSALTKLSYFLSKYSQGFIGGICSALLTSLVFIFLVRTPDDKMKVLDSNQFAAISLPTHKEVPFADNRDAGSSDKSADEIKALSTIKHPNFNPSRRSQLNIIPAPDDAGLLADANSAASVAKQPLPILSISPNIYNIFEPGIKDGGKNFAVAPNIYYIQVPESKNLFGIGKLGFSVELSGSQYWQLQSNPSARSTTPLFNNTAIAVIIPIGNGFELLADIRQEYFFQRFDGIGNDGIPYLYEQHPNFVSLGAGARYTFLRHDIFGSFLQAMAAGNEVGIVGRLMVGGEIAFSDDYKFVLGLEGSFLSYHHQNNTHSSTKIGLTYGVVFNF